MDASNFRVLELNEALDRVGGDLDLLREVAELFLRDSPKMMAAVKTACAAGDAPALARAAHNLKGCVGTFCADQAFDAAQALEAAGRNEDLSAAVGDLFRLAAAIEALTPELSALAGGASEEPA